MSDTLKIEHFTYWVAAVVVVAPLCPWKCVVRVTADERLLAFPADQVSRITGLSERQLRYWDKTGFFHPQYAEEDRRRPYSRVYSFQDIVGLRTIALLINEHQLPMRELRKVGEWLYQYHDAPWSELRFYVWGRHVYFDDPISGARMATHHPGQLTFSTIDMEEVAQAVRREVDRVRRREPEHIGHIMQHRFVVHNEPVLAGTRIPTEAIWNLHAAGYDTDAILYEYPDLTPDDVRAAISHEQQRHQRRAG